MAEYRILASRAAMVERTAQGLVQRCSAAAAAAAPAPAAAAVALVDAAQAAGVARDEAKALTDAIGALEAERQSFPAAAIRESALKTSRDAADLAASLRSGAVQSAERARASMDRWDRDLSSMARKLDDAVGNTQYRVALEQAVETQTERLKRALDALTQPGSAGAAAAGGPAPVEVPSGAIAVPVGTVAAKVPAQGTPVADATEDLPADPKAAVPAAIAGRAAEAPRLASPEEVGRQFSSLGDSLYERVRQDKVRGEAAEVVRALERAGARVDARVGSWGEGLDDSTRNLWVGLLVAGTWAVLVLLSA